MKKKKLTIIFITLLIIFGLSIFIYNKNSNKIEDGYMMVFHGEKNKIKYETYIYKTKDKEYKYINTTDNNKKIKVTKKGIVKKEKDIFEIAKKNNAYDYITLADKEEKYMVEDFKEMLVKK